MPKFRLPEPKKPKKEKNVGLAETSMDMEWRRRVTIPANKAIINELKVGGEARVILTGSIISLASREHMDRPADSNLEIDVSVVEAYSTEDSDDDFEEGYKEASGKE